MDELLRLLQVWEAETARLKAEEAARLGESENPEGEASQESNLVRLRYAIIGWLFENEANLVRRTSSLVRSEGPLDRLLRRAMSPLRFFTESRLAAPIRGQWERWVARGEQEAARWIALGREEEAHSRMLAQVAFDKTVDEYIEYLTQNPEVKELVQQQSSGLANEVIEEVRERTVSADTFLEGLARSLLRRFPRRELPPPPPEVIARAAPRQHSDLIEKH